MTPKTVIITGASSGIGLVAARALAAQGAGLVLVCRSPVRAEVARREVAAMATGPAPMVLIADLASQASIRALAAEIRAKVPRPDVLVNNAGAIFARRELTDDGIERTFAVNHLAPFLLTNLLLDRLKAAPAGRVVTVASEAYPSRLEFDNLQGEKRYHFLLAYMRSKLANILFSHELARRMAGSSVTANSLSPGPSQTRFGDDLTGAASLFPKIMKRIPGLFAPAEKGARDVIRLASAPEMEGVSGRFYLHGKDRRSKPVTYDSTIAARLWWLSEGLTGLNAATPARAAAGIPQAAVA
jgi:NAD(P)-dependent dehydrogenase (short-subunit alcohol dehydrogenase family)